MADISYLSRLINGASRNVDLTSNTPIVLSIKVGGSGSNTELTKTLLDGLLAIRTDLASTANAKGASLVGIEDAASIITATTVEGALAENRVVANSAQTTANAAIPATQKGAANGVAPLDGSSKISALYLPSYVDDVLEVANFAALPGVGETGKIYVTLDTNKTYRWTGSVYVEVSPSDVNSVFGRTGIVTAQSGDYTTLLVTENTNLYFTDTRAKTAAVVNSLAGSQTDQAPSVSAVNAALAGVTPTGQVESLFAGEGFTSGQLRAVRWAKAADSGFVAGRVYKADATATSVDNFWVQGLALPGTTISAGGALTVYKAGPITATGHGFTVGEPIFLGTAGALTNTAPAQGSTFGSVVVGFARDANTIEVQISVMGVA